MRLTAIDVRASMRAPCVRRTVAPLPGATHDVSSGYAFDDEVGPYHVWTHFDPPGDELEKKPYDFRSLYEMPSDAVDEPDLRPDTLELDRDSLRVHHIRRIAVETDAVRVNRHNRHEDPFRSEP